MSGTPTVWVVEQGEYSDYRVVGVFSSEANAQIVADAINGPDADKGWSSKATIAEWPLNPAVSELLQGYSQYLVLMHKDGTVERCTHNDTTGYSIRVQSVDIWRRTKAPAFIGKGIPDVLTATVWAKDETHAIKIANEHRTQLIATGKWDSD